MDIPTVAFEAVIAVPDAFYQCPGAYILVNRDPNGNRSLICNFLFGDRVQTTPAAPTHGQLHAAALNLSTDAARELARALMSFADKADEE